MTSSSDVKQLRKAGVVGLERVESAAARERRARADLGDAIVTARKYGSSWREIASASGYSVEGVRKIARALEGQA